MTVRSFRSAPRRYSPTEELFLAHQSELLNFIADRTDTDSHTIEDLVQETWLTVLASGPIDSLSTSEEGLPLVLRRAARKAIYRYFTDSLTWPEPMEGPAVTRLSAAA